MPRSCKEMAHKRRNGKDYLFLLLSVLNKLTLNKVVSRWGADLLDRNHSDSDVAGILQFL